MPHGPAEEGENDGEDRQPGGGGLQEDDFAVIVQETLVLFRIIHGSTLIVLHNLHERIANLSSHGQMTGTRSL